MGELQLNCMKREQNDSLSLEAKPQQAPQSEDGHEDKEILTPNEWLEKETFFVLLPI